MWATGSGSIGSRAVTPAGKPIVMIHGGPGGAPNSGLPKYVDPDAYRLVRLHQRGCGRSTPHVGDFDVPLTRNTTQRLIADIEQLRGHLGIQRWLVHGGSWGVTLGLAYAQAYPQRVSEMLLVSVTLTRAVDVHWFAHQTGRYGNPASHVGLDRKMESDPSAALRYPRPAVRPQGIPRLCLGGICEGYPVVLRRLVRVEGPLTGGGSGI
jgi:pimeloyl-ACP methyl ester carboxylesterase